MVSPAAVDHAQDNPALEFSHRRLAELLGTALVRELRIGEDLLTEERTVDPAARTRLGEQLIDRDGDRVDDLEFTPQRVEIPVVRVALTGVVVDDLVDDVVKELRHAILQVVALEDVAAVAVDRLALAVQHIVVLQHVLADLRVARLDLALRAADGAAHDFRFDREVIRNVSTPHEGFGSSGVEQAHEVVGKRQVEAALARVALAAGPSTKLVVDSTGLVAFGSEYVEPTNLDDLRGLNGNALLDRCEDGVPLRLVLVWRLDGAQALRIHLGDGEKLCVAAEHDVGATTGHVSGDRDGSEPSGLGDDRRLTRVVLRVEHFVLHSALGEKLRQVFALLDARCSDQHGLALLVARVDVLNDLAELGLLVLVNEVGLVPADHRLVRRDWNDPELVGAHELRGLGLGRTGHPGELLVQAEVVLQSDGRKSLVLGLDRNPFLRLDRLVDALVVATADQDAAGVLIDDEHFAVHDDVVLVALEQRRSLDGVVEEGDQWSVGRLVQVVDAEVILDLLDAGLQNADRALLLIDLVVDLGNEALGHLRELGEPAIRLPG